MVEGGAWKNPFKMVELIIHKKYMEKGVNSQVDKEEKVYSPFGGKHREGQINQTKHSL